MSWLRFPIEREVYTGCLFSETAVVIFIRAVMSPDSQRKSSAMIDNLVASAWFLSGSPAGEKQHSPQKHCEAQFGHFS